jgi:Chaperone of endosialidase
MDTASEVILALKPVRFHYKNDAKRSPRFGLIAEEVAEIDPSLVAFDKERKPYSVRYDQVNAMLLNEFLKEHRKVQKLEAIVAEQKKGTQVLTGRLEEQAKEIQNISTKIDLNKAGSPTIATK